MAQSAGQVLNNDDELRNYAVGLKMVSSGIWNWPQPSQIAGEGFSTEYKHWKPGSLAGTTPSCTYISVKTGVNGFNGYWQPASCASPAMRAVCQAYWNNEPRTTSMGPTAGNSGQTATTDDSTNPGISTSPTRYFTKYAQ